MDLTSKFLVKEARDQRVQEFTAISDNTPTLYIVQSSYIIIILILTSVRDGRSPEVDMTSSVGLLSHSLYRESWKRHQCCD